MANQEKDQLAAAEDGAGDRSATEGAVSTGEAPASGTGAATAPGAAGAQHATEGNGRPGLAEDPSPAVDGPVPDVGTSDVGTSDFGASEARVDRSPSADPDHGRPIPPDTPRACHFSN